MTVPGDGEGSGAIRRPRPRTGVPLTPEVLLDRVADLDPGGGDAVRALALAVYPPDQAADWPGRRLEWARPEWCVRVQAGGTLVSYVGIWVRDAALDGRPVRVGGIGGVKTHPAFRGRGLATLGMERAARFLAGSPDVAFALLVCEPRLVPYYGRRGWREFSGRLVVRQHGAAADFTFNRVMTLAIRRPAPAAGTLDLMGPPW